MNGAHVCLSGSLECSGVAPCDPCASAIVTYVLVPAMKAAGIDQRNDPRVAHFLQTYHGSQRHLIAGLMAQVPPPPPPPVVNPRPTHPPVADLPLTEAELEAMATPVSPETVAAPAASMVDAAMMGGAEEPPPPVVMPPPAGMLSDDEFKARFPSAVPEELIAGYTAPAPPPPPLQEPRRSERLTDDGTYPNVEEEQAKLAERASASKLPEPAPSEPSLLKLAAQSITPKLPADEPTSVSSEVGSAPTQPAPSSTPQPKAPTEDAAPVSAVSTPADSTATKAEAHSHG